MNENALLKMNFNLSIIDRCLVRAKDTFKYLPIGVITSHKWKLFRRWSNRPYKASERELFIARRSRKEGLEYILKARRPRLNLLSASVRTLTPINRWLVGNYLSRDRSDGESRVDVKNQLYRNRCCKRLHGLATSVFNATRPTYSLPLKTSFLAIGVVSFALLSPPAQPLCTGSGYLNQ